MVTCPKCDAPIARMQTRVVVWYQEPMEYDDTDHDDTGRPEDTPTSYWSEDLCPNDADPEYYCPNGTKEMPHDISSVVGAADELEVD